MDNIDLLHVANNCNESFSPEQRRKLLFAYGGTGIGSAVVCAVAMVMMGVMRLYKHFIYRLAVYQVLGSFLQAFSMGLVLTTLDYDDKLLYYRVACNLTAFFQQYAGCVKLLFTSWLTFHLFSYVVFFKNLKNLEWLYISSSVLGPLLFAWIPFIHHSYGLAGAWCYIRSWKDDCATEKYTEGIIEQFALYYGPAALFLLINIIAISFMVAVMLWRAHKSYYNGDLRPLVSARDQHIEVLKQTLPLLTYPVIYFTLLLIPLSNRFYMAVSSSNNYGYVFAHAVAHPLMCFFAGLVLIIHMCYVLRWRSRGRPTESNADYPATFSGITPYTSGAITKFSLPNESY